MDQEIVKELIQHEFNIDNLKEELQNILKEKEQTAIKEGYRTLRKKLGGGGASEKAAKVIWNALKE